LRDAVGRREELHANCWRVPIHPFSVTPTITSVFFIYKKIRKKFNNKKERKLLKTDNPKEED
jgi:hypothetical protein